MEIGKDFFCVLGLCIFNKAFRYRMIEEFDRAIQDFDLNAEEKSALKRLVEEPSWLNDISSQIEWRIMDTVVARGQRTGWMGGIDPIPF